MEGGGGGTGKVRRRRPPWSALPRPMLPQGRGAPGFTLARNGPPPPGRHTAVAPRAAARASAPGGGGAHPSPPRWWWWSRRKEGREGWRGTKKNGGGGRPCRRCVAGDGRAPPPPQRVRRARRGPGRPAVLPRPAAPASGAVPGHPTGPAGRRAVEPGAAQPALPGRPPHPLARPPPPAWAAGRPPPTAAGPPAPPARQHLPATSVWAVERAGRARGGSAGCWRHPRPPPARHRQGGDPHATKPRAAAAPSNSVMAAGATTGARPPPPLPPEAVPWTGAGRGAVPGSGSLWRPRGNAPRAPRVPCTDDPPRGLPRCVPIWATEPRTETTGAVAVATRNRGGGEQQTKGAMRQTVVERGRWRVGAPRRHATTTTGRTRRRPIWLGLHYRVGRRRPPRRRRGARGVRSGAARRWTGERARARRGGRQRRARRGGRRPSTRVFE